MECHRFPQPEPSVWQTLPSWGEAYRRRRWVFLLLAALVVWGVTDVRRRARIDAENPTVHKTDFTVYTEAGSAFFDGRDPYAVTNPRGWHYLYPPLFAIVVAPLAALDSQWQAMIWYLFSLATAFGCWRECKTLARLVQSAGDRRPAAEPGAGTAWIGWLAAATVALPALNCLQRGQVGILLVYLLLLGLRLVVESRSFHGSLLGGVALALPIAIKLTPALPAGVLLLAAIAAAVAIARTYAGTVTNAAPGGFAFRAWGLAAGQAIGLVLFLLVLPGAFVGHRQNLSHLQTWVSRVVANDDVGIENDFNARSKRNQSLANSVRRFGNAVAYAAGMGPDDQLVDDIANANRTMPMENAVVDVALKLAALALVAAVFVAAWRVAGRDDALGLAAVFGLACAATLVVSPISWGHHYVMWLPGLLFVPLWLWQNERPLAARQLAVTAAVLMMAHYLAMGFAGRIGVLGIGCAVWVAVAAVRLIQYQPATAAEADEQIDKSPHLQAYRRAA